MELNITKLQQDLKDLETQMQLPEILTDNKKITELGKKYSETKYTFDLLEKIEKNKSDLASLQASMSQESDEEMLVMTHEEIDQLKTQLDKDLFELEEIVHPLDPRDKKSVILEIRAGTGGDESALFASELYRMYSRFAEKMGWKVKILSQNRTGLGGFKEIIAEIVGDNVYKYLKFESGVHRVQRVPETEKAGRVHTSAATVAVMPEAEEVDLVIEAKDIRIDTFCASGHGGQSVNTTKSAVRITHLPTGTVVSCQDEKSQGQNKEKAMAILRSRILDKMEEDQHQKLAQDRKSQVGSGDRSEKIRTYNFPQDRLTDHRIKLTLHNLAIILDGELLPIIMPLQQAARSQKN
ncbi:MAG: peptide chain release factor 1 [Patescibacteria group bacterium]|jgi:peptide chain release factor 1